MLLIKFSEVQLYNKEALLFLNKTRQIISIDQRLLKPLKLLTTELYNQRAEKMAIWTIINGHKFHKERIGMSRKVSNTSNCSVFVRRFEGMIIELMTFEDHLLGIHNDFRLIISNKSFHNETVE